MHKFDCSNRIPFHLKMLGTRIYDLVLINVILDLASKNLDFKSILIMPFK